MNYSKICCSKLLFLTGALAALPGSFSCSETAVVVDPVIPEEPEPPVSPSMRPNILLIVTDQQSFNTISAHATQFPGSVYSSTPNIDRLVRSGVSFTRAYCANPVSVPSRFSLFSGEYGGQYGVRENQSPEADETAIRRIQQEQALGVVFRKAGYQTFYGGKVHLPFAASSGGSKFAAPVAYGFDNYFTDNEREGLGLAVAGLINEQAAAWTLARNSKAAPKPFLMVASFLNPHDICLESSTNLSPEVADDPKDPEKVATIRMMRERLAAIDPEVFLRDHAPALPLNDAKPQDYPDTKCSRKRFLNYPDTYWRQYRWIYGQLVSLVDSHIGKVLDALDAHPVLKENTLIVFTSDHGEMQGAHGAVTKSLPFEECQRVPFIFAGWNLPANTLVDRLVCNGVDLLPTLCDIAGIKVPEGVDGVSLASLVKGEEPSKAILEREYLYFESETFVAVRQADYKLTHFDLDGKYSFLVDLAKDGGEMKNVAPEQPAVVSKLQQYLSTRK